MTVAPDLVETLCLGQLSNLEQLEGPWLELMATGDPESVALALRLLLCHLEHTASMTQRAMVIAEVERSFDSSATPASS